MINTIKGKLATQIYHYYKDKENDFRNMPQFLIEETENTLQWIKENTSEEAKRIIIAVENDDNELFEKLTKRTAKNLEEASRAEELFTTIIIDETIKVELFLLLLLTRRDIKQFITALVGGIKTTRVVPIAAMLIYLLQSYEEVLEMDEVAPRL